MAAQTAAVSKKALWTGRSISGWLVLFLLFDGVVKVIKLAPAMEGTGRSATP
jgi:hypothetical protein